MSRWEGKYGLIILENYIYSIIIINHVFQHIYETTKLCLHNMFRNQTTAERESVMYYHNKDTHCSLWELNMRNLLCHTSIFIPKLFQAKIGDFLIHLFLVQFHGCTTSPIIFFSLEKRLYTVHGLHLFIWRAF